VPITRFENNQSIGPQRVSEHPKDDPYVGQGVGSGSTVVTAAPKGKWTFRIAAVLFVISALTELLPPTAPVPLFGIMRGGPVALFYHLFYAGLYVGLGVGLWQARPWGYTLVLFATGVYTLDRLQLLLFRKAVLADLLRKPGPIGEVFAAVDSHLLVAVFTAATLMILLCWWGFAVYAYLRRDYFSNA
jgi:hypothetical protein